MISPPLHVHVQQFRVDVETHGTEPLNQDHGGKEDRVVQVSNGVPHGGDPSDESQRKCPQREQQSNEQRAPQIPYGSPPDPRLQSSRCCWISGLATFAKKTIFIFAKMTRTSRIYE